MIPFKTKLRNILKQRKISLTRFSEETEIDRTNFFYKDMHKHCRYVYMAIAYYLDMTLEELLEGTDEEYLIY